MIFFHWALPLAPWLQFCRCQPANCCEALSCDHGAAHAVHLTCTLSHGHCFFTTTGQRAHSQGQLCKPSLGIHSWNMGSAAAPAVADGRLIVDSTHSSSLLDGRQAGAVGPGDCWRPLGLKHLSATAAMTCSGKKFTCSCFGSLVRTDKTDCWYKSE